MKYLNKEIMKSRKILIVDGYNIINAWDSLKELAKTDLNHSRDKLIDIIIEFASFTGRKAIIVFDAYNVKNSIETKEKRKNVVVVYTKEHQTADSYIESYVDKLSKYDDVKVATNDYAEQQIVLGKGATRISSRELSIEIENIKQKIKESNNNGQKRIQRHSLEDRLNSEVLSKLEKIRRSD